MCRGHVLEVSRLNQSLAAPPPLNKHSAGFSLIELAILLVIIGLLVGGVLMGRNLIRNADLQTVVTDATRYRSATTQFMDKYLALPGDFSEATAMWGATDATLATCVVTASTGTETCDGNGNGIISTLGTAFPSNMYEAFGFWKHLENEGLIKGKFTGIQATANIGSTIAGQNAPASSIDNGTWLVAWDSSSGGAMFDVAIVRHNLRLGGQVVGWPTGHILTTQEAWNIDTKMDDGRPGLGIATAPKSTYPGVPNCTTTAVAATAEYKLSYTSIACTMYFGLDR